MAKYVPPAGWDLATGCSRGQNPARQAGSTKRSPSPPRSAKGEGNSTATNASQKMRKKPVFSASDPRGKFPRTRSAKRTTGNGKHFKERDLQSFELESQPAAGTNRGRPDDWLGAITPQPLRNGQEGLGLGNADDAFRHHGIHAQSCHLNLSRDGRRSQRVRLGRIIPSHRFAFNREWSRRIIRLKFSELLNQ